MLLQEMFSSYDPAYQDLANDNSVLRGLQDQRKTRLTLGRINKIRKMNDLRKHEKAKELQDVIAQYGSGGSESDIAAPF